MAPIVLVRKRGAGGPPPAAPPVNTVAPVASGTGTIGQILSVTDGTWTGDPVITFTYQWQRNGVNIGGATANTYLLVSADGGKSVRCVVTGTNGVGASSANSNAISVAAALTYAQEVLADSPVGYWKFNEGSGTNIIDYGSAGLNMTTHASPVLSNPGPLTGETGMTLVGASSQYADVAFGSGVLQSGDTYSIEYWFKRSATQGSYQWVYSNGANTFLIGLCFTDTNTILGQVRPSSTIFLSTPTFTDTSSWHHFVFTKNGSTRAGYIDGAAIAFTGANDTVLSVSGTLNIGRIDGAGFYYTGSVAQVAYYNTALSAARVLAHYNAAA